MNHIESLIHKHCPNGVEFRALKDICALMAGDRIIKSMMNDNEKYPVMGGGVVPTGYYKDYNFAQGITIARAGSAGSVAWQENPFWATDVCFVATLPEFCHTERSEVSKNKGANLHNPLDSSVASQPQNDKDIDCHDFAYAKSRNDNLNLKFLFYYLKTSQSDLQKHLYGGSMPKLDKAYLWNYQIPLPPIEIQREIVKILDTFTELEKELEKELEARKKQYHYYRERLLSFESLERRARLHALIAERQGDSFPVIASERSERGNPPASSLRGSGEATTKQSNSCHTEALAEVSKNKDANLQNKQSAVSLENLLDSSLHATRSAQNDKNIDCHSPNGLRNDGSAVDCHEFDKSNSRNDGNATSPNDNNDKNNNGGGQFVKMMCLSEIGTFVRGNGLQKKDFVESGVPCIHYGQIYTYYGTWTNETKSFVSKEVAKKLKKAQKGNLIIAGVSENKEDVCRSVVYLGNDEICISGDSFAFAHSQNPKFIGYFFQTDNFNKQKTKHITGTKVMRVHIDSLKTFQIPIPPLAVQNEVVKILDRFDALVNDITQGLPAEIHARKKQYEYYREKLLSFKEIA